MHPNEAPIKLITFLIQQGMLAVVVCAHLFASVMPREACEWLLLPAFVIVGFTLYSVGQGVYIM